MKNIKTLLLASVIAFTISCNNQAPTESSDLAVPVTVLNIKKRSISQYINTTGTAKAKAEASLNSEVTGEYQLQTNPRTGRLYKTRGM